MLCSACGERGTSATNRSKTQNLTLCALFGYSEKRLWPLLPLDYIDCYGLLSSIYRYAAVAYVGGGFGVGIHNVPEAAVYGVPVIIGPNNHKFREARALIKTADAAKSRMLTTLNVSWTFS